MGQLIEEQLSALLDGELAAEEEELLLRRLEHEPRYRAVLARYSLIGEFMRDANTGSAALRLSERVHAEISAESAHDGAGVPLGKARPASGWKSLGKGLIGAGIAAAVAALSLNLFFDTNTPASPDARVVDNQASYTVPALPVSGDVIASTRLTSYLVSHREFSSALSRRTMDSHIVSRPPVAGEWGIRNVAEDD